MYLSITDKEGKQISKFEALPQWFQFIYEMLAKEGYQIQIINTNGRDGFSPIANVTQGTGSAVISITDAAGTTTATIYDGEQGPSGEINSITATIDDNTGTPSIDVVVGGTPQRRDIQLQFHNLKGQQAEVINNVISTYVDKALSANMGKVLQDQISNLKNIGRFLSIWDCTTGQPLTQPSELPYTYRTGDYFRVGTVATGSGTNYKPDGSTYTGTASTTVETESVAVGAVYYYDGTVWRMQSASGGGTVQDVQINGTSIIDSGTGVANIMAIPYSSTAPDADNLLGAKPIRLDYEPSAYYNGHVYFITEE